MSITHRYNYHCFSVLYRNQTLYAQQRCTNCGPWAIFARDNSQSGKRNYLLPATTRSFNFLTSKDMKESWFLSGPQLCVKVQHMVALNLYHNIQNFVGKTCVRYKLNCCRSRSKPICNFTVICAYFTKCLFEHIDYDGVKLCLRTAATNGPIVHPRGDMWAWRTMVLMMMPAKDNFWLVHQSSLAVLPAETSGTNRRNEQRSENFAYQYLKYFNRSLTCRKI
jgi:hypothetical protein